MELTTEELFYNFELDRGYFNAPLYDFEVNLELELFLMIQKVKKEAFEILKKHYNKFPEEKRESIDKDRYDESLTYLTEYLEGREKAKMEILDEFLYSLKELYVKLYKNNTKDEKLKSQMSEIRKDKLALRRKVIFVKE